MSALRKKGKEGAGGGEEGEGKGQRTWCSAASWTARAFANMGSSCCPSGSRRTLCASEGKGWNVSEPISNTRARPSPTKGGGVGEGEREKGRGTDPPLIFFMRKFLVGSCAGWFEDDSWGRFEADEDWRGADMARGTRVGEGG